MKVEILATAPPFEPVKVDGFVWHVLSGNNLSYLDMKFLKVLEEPWDDEVAD
jgi:hypothetical protein